MICYPHTVTAVRRDPDTINTLEERKGVLFACVATGELTRETKTELFLNAAWWKKASETEMVLRGPRRKDTNKTQTSKCKEKRRKKRKKEKEEHTQKSS